MKLIRLIFVIHALLLVSCSSGANNSALSSGNNHFPKFNDKDYKLVHRFYGKDKTPLGNVYLKYITDEVFTSMVIKTPAGNEILYFIDSAQLIGKAGIDTKVYEEGFYGYKVILLKDDYIVINYLRNEGKFVSDDITIEWSYGDNKFEVMKAP